jgi:hypothetical protein
MNTDFHPQFLEDTSAWLFWTLSARDGFSPTLADVLETSGRSLLKCTELDEIFSRYPLEGMPAEEFTRLYDAIAEYAWNKAIREENLTGTIFSEDRISGRSPSAADIHTENFNLPLTVEGDTLPAYGTLCIRHPLPAVVFASTPPPDGYFRIADTSALGFSAHLWFCPQFADQIDDEVWLLGGYFYIPENIDLAGRPWTEVIPNAICAREEMVLQGRKGPVNLHFTWQQVDMEVKSVRKRLADKLKVSALNRLLFGQNQ